MITPESEALKLENRSSLSTFTETLKKRSERSLSSKFRPPGFIK